MATDASAANAYLATKVLTASPQELRLMLLDGALKFAIQGRDGLASKNFEAVYNGFTRCRAILVELTTTMKPEPDRELYARLTSLYLFMISHLVAASHERDVSKADEVIKLLQFERQTWVMLMEKLAAESRGGTSGTPRVPAQAHVPSGSPLPAVPLFSFQG